MPNKLKAIRWVATTAFWTIVIVFSTGISVLAACTSPAGNEGEVVYNTDSNVPQYCNGTYWIAMGPLSPSANGSGCTNPVSPEGEIVFNSDHNVMQYCDSVSWKAMGPVPGTGGAGCTDPVSDLGEMMYNSDYNVMQYCDGATLRQIGTLGTVPAPDPCSGSPSIGTVCSDGSVYAGLSPDGNVPMYVTRCDFGQTWDGSACSGARSARQWNDGSGNWLDTPLANCTTNSPNAISACNTGKSNSAFLNTADSSSVGGTQAHHAAQACESLNLHGKDDWYLPAQGELYVMWGGRSAIGHFLTTSLTDHYWSSSEGSSTNAMHIVFFNGDQSAFPKYGWPVYFRCARR